MSDKTYDAVVVGAGPNGLSAGVELARRGLSVCVPEAKEAAGGGARTLELTGPGLLRDVCSAIHPVGVVSAFFRTLPLGRWGVERVYPDVALAHPFDDGDAARLLRSIEATGALRRLLRAPGAAARQDGHVLVRHGAGAGGARRQPAVRPRRLAEDGQSLALLSFGACAICVRGSVWPPRRP